MAPKEKAKEYFNELTKLIKKCPNGYLLVYDSDKGLFMVPKNSCFDHGDMYSPTPAVCISVGMTYRPTKSDSDGYCTIVAEGIDQRHIDLAAVSSNAIIE